MLLKFSFFHQILFTIDKVKFSWIVFVVGLFVPSKQYVQFRLHPKLVNQVKDKKS